MSKTSVYQLSGKQLILLAVASALIAVGATALIYNYGRLLMAKSGADTTFAEQAPPATISDPNSVSDEQNNIEVYKTISPGVAFINTTTYQQDFWGDVSEGRGNGSGFMIDSTGNILTNYHVIEGAQKLSVSFGGGKTYPARVVGGDADTDLAVIKIDPPAGVTVVEFGDSDKLTVGQKVLAIGNPFGLDRTLTTGVISGLQRPIRARNGRPIDAAIQTDASINPGNSGGPLLDKFGKMIGINSQILSPAGGSVGVGFAVPANTAKRVVAQILQFGEVRRPKLGASLIPAADVAQRGYRVPVESGLIIQRVDAGSPAALAGLRGLSQSMEGLVWGDIVLSIDGEAMNDLDSLYRYLDKKQIGETVKVEIYRNGSRVSVPIKLTASPTRPAQPATRRTE